MKKQLLMLTLCLLNAGSACFATDYYIDAQKGNDTQKGTSPRTAWQSLRKVSALTLQAGDKVLLKKGDTFEGMLELHGEGTKHKPILITAYGNGKEMPCIKGLDQSMYAVRIYNSSYMTLKGLRIINQGKERLAGRTGLKVECKDYGVSKDIRILDITVQDVNGSLVKAKGGGSGMLFVNGGKEKISWFENLTIEDCHIKDCARNAMIWGGYASRGDWHPSLYTKVRGNLIEGVPGDGIVPIGCDHTLIEYNVMRDCPDILPDTEAAAGFWPWSCDNTIIRFNEVSGHKAPWDGQAYDSDWNCTNTVIEYNYSHDNYGGLALICNDGSSHLPFSIGNKGTILRYNVSINDGLRPKKTRGGMFSPAIHIGGPAKGSLIEHNIIHLNKKASPEIDTSILTSDSWNGYADSTTIRRNIFYAAERGHLKLTKSTHNVLEGNYYLGHYTEIPAEDKEAHTKLAVYQSVLANDPKGFNGLKELMMEKELKHCKGTFINPVAIGLLFKRLDAE